MTVQSPSVRIFVASISSAASEPTVGLALAVAGLRRGETNRVIVSGGSGSAYCLVLVAGRVAGDGVLAELRGVATAEEGGPSATGDDLQPARALRRALADGRMNAADIGYACAFELGSDSDRRAMAALERGLGRFATATVLEVGPDPLVRCARVVTGRDGSVDGALALLINPGIGSIAVAFGRP